MERVLVIDDCEEFLSTIEAILQDAGFGVKVALSPVEARKALSKEKFDIVLCDLVLPMEDTEDEIQGDSALVGVYAISELTRDFPKLPVVAMSGALTGDPLSAMQTFGAVGALSKPFCAEELVSTIRQVLNPTGDELVQ